MPEHTPEIAPALYARALAAAGEADYDIADEAFKCVLEFATHSKLWQEAALSLAIGRTCFAGPAVPTSQNELHGRRTIRKRGKKRAHQPRNTA